MADLESESIDFSMSLIERMDLYKILGSIQINSNPILEIDSVSGIVSQSIVGTVSSGIVGAGSLIPLSL